MSLMQQGTFVRLVAFARRSVVATWVAACVCFAGSAAWAQGANEEVDAEEAAEDEASDDMPMEELVVTGSRIARTAGELGKQVIVIDEEEIKAAGEPTLERLLRQLPQNQNPTTEQFGQRLNTGTNFTGASTVNLRSLGSESTLILVNGKRIGASGILGGVTDISSIPLNMVERVEIVLDGASAIYGSDAVGGVVNVITRRDYEEIDVNLNLEMPSDTAYSEFRAGVAGTAMMGDLRVSGSFNQSIESGLDAADRDEAIFQQSVFPGPQFDISGFLSNPAFYRLDGSNISIDTYNDLPAIDRGRAEPVFDAVLPEGWNSASSLSSIEIFEPPQWGSETQAGYSVIPEASKATIGGSVEVPMMESMSGSFDLRYESRTTTFEQGYITLSGLSLHPDNPFNPFGTRVSVSGQRRDIGNRPHTETDSSTLDWTASLNGDIGDRWSFSGSFGQTSSTLEAGRFNQLDRSAVFAGMNSDGVTPITRYLSGLTPEECAAMGGTVSFGLCRVLVDPPDPIDPWGDLSPYISKEPLMAESENGESRLEGFVSGDVMAMPGGMARALAGFSLNTVSLETVTEFPVGLIESSPVSDVAEFNTSAERTNSSIFFELAMPLVGAGNSTPGMEAVTVSVSGRNDNYDTPDITYTDADGVTTGAEGIASIGGETTMGLGVSYLASESFRIRLNRETSFVAPQLNQLLLETTEGISAPFRGLWLIQPNGDLQVVSAIVKTGGNPDLLPETATSTSLGFEYRFPAAPQYGVGLTWSAIDYQDRISLLSTFTFSPDAPPSNTYYDEETSTWFQDRRWVNVSSVERRGIDLDVFYGWTTDNGDITVRWRSGRTLKYDYVLDPATDSAISIVGTVTDEDGRAALVPPVSKSVDSVQAIWTTNQWTASVDVNFGSETKQILGATTSPITTEYTPPLMVDFTFDYGLDGTGWVPLPASFSNSRLRLTINNLLRQYGESKIFNSEGVELEPQSPSGSPLRGSLLQFSFNTSIGQG